MVSVYGFSICVGNLFFTFDKFFVNLFFGFINEM